jgi:multiple sugar transport system substrate-binding protein
MEEAMKRCFSVISMAMIVLIIAIGFMGCKGKSGGTKTLTYWCAYSQPERIEALDKITAIYEQENPGIKVVRELVPWGNIKQKYVSSKMAKTLPQLVVSTPSEMINMWQGGDLAAVDDVVDLVGKNEWSEGPLSEWYMDGHYFAVPHYTLSWKMIVRTDWLKELGLPIPKTWDEFAKTAIAMTNPPERYGFDLPLNIGAQKGGEWLDYFMRTNGAEFWSKDGKANFNTPEVIETVQFLCDTVRKTGRQAMYNYNEDDTANNFAKGNVGFIFTTSSFINNNLLKINPDLIDKFDVIDTPIKKNKGRVGAGPVGIGKYKNVNYQDEASKLLAFFFREDVYRTFLLTMSMMIPVTKAPLNDPLYTQDASRIQYGYLYDKWNEGTVTSGHKIGFNYGPTLVPSAGLTGTEMETMFHSILIDNVPVAEAVRITNDRMQANLTAAGL